MNFTSAGCLFTDEMCVLAGYQTRKQKPFLSGLGGKRRGEETYFVTALRETLEELFEIKTVPLEWIEDILQEVPFPKELHNGDYIFLLYTFDDLERMLQRLSRKNIQSPLYTIFPTTKTQLLFERKKTNPPAEISHLALLPLVSQPPDNPLVSHHFLKDIRIFLEKNSQSIDRND